MTWRAMYARPYRVLLHVHAALTHFREVGVQLAEQRQEPERRHHGVGPSKYPRHVMPRHASSRQRMSLRIRGCNITQ